MISLVKRKERRKRKKMHKNDGNRPIDLAKKKLERRMTTRKMKLNGSNTRRKS